MSETPAQRPAPPDPGWGRPARVPSPTGGCRAGWRSVALALATLAIGGCLRDVVREGQPPEATPPPAIRGGLDLEGVGITRLAVVEPLDRTDRGAGMPAAEALVEALVLAGVPVHTSVLRRPASALSAAWLGQQSRLTGANGFATGTVSAFAIQVAQGRAFLAMTAIVIDPGGRIVWSRRISAQAPLYTEGSLAVAARIAAKEFASDLVASRP